MSTRIANGIAKMIASKAAAEYPVGETNETENEKRCHLKR